MKRLALLLLVVISVGCHAGHAATPDTPAVTDYCEGPHHVPFIDAEHCGGMTSCDRMAFAGHPVPCPK